MPDEETQVTMPESAESEDFAIDEVNTEDSAGENPAQETADPETNQQNVNETQPGAESKGTVDEPFLTIKYNGENENLTRDDAITLAQKGRNYDKVHEQLEQMRNDPTIGRIQQLAQSANLSVNDYLDRLGQFERESAILRLQNDFSAKNPNVDTSVARQYAEQAYKAQTLTNEKQEVQTKEDEQAQMQADVQAEIEGFAKRHPDFDLNNTPDEVIENVRNGMNLETAYLAYQNHQLTDKLKAFETNSKNKAKAVGSVSQNSATEGSKDPFLTGLGF